MRRGEEIDNQEWWLWPCLCYHGYKQGREGKGIIVMFCACVWCQSSHTGTFLSYPTQLCLLFPSPSISLFQLSDIIHCFPTVCLLKARLCAQIVSVCVCVLSILKIEWKYMVMIRVIKVTQLLQKSKSVHPSRSREFLISGVLWENF